MTDSQETTASIQDEIDRELKAGLDDGFSAAELKRTLKESRHFNDGWLVATNKRQRKATVTNDSETVVLSSDDDEVMARPRVLKETRAARRRQRRR